MANVMSLKDMSNARTTTKPDDANEDISLVPSASAARERHPKTASRVEPNPARTRREVATPRSEGPDALGPVKHPARTTPRFEEQAVQVMLRAAVVVARARSSIDLAMPRSHPPAHPFRGVDRHLLYRGIFRVHDSSIS